MILTMTEMQERHASIENAETVWKCLRYYGALPVVEIAMKCRLEIDLTRELVEMLLRAKRIRKATGFSDERWTAK